MANTNKEKYDKVFVESFGISKDDLNNKLAYNSITAWDSIGHMGMINQLEEEFKITFEVDDIVGFSSYDKGREILAKYSINLD